MAKDFPEAQWRKFRKLHATALQRYCRRVIKELEYIRTDKESTWHERYLAVFKRLHEHNEEMARAFDDASRSNALTKLCCVVRLNLLTEAELDQFSPEIQESVQQFLPKSSND